MKNLLASEPHAVPVPAAAAAVIDLRLTPLGDKGANVRMFFSLRSLASSATVATEIVDGEERGINRDGTQTLMVRFHSASDAAS